METKQRILSASEAREISKKTQIGSFDKAMSFIEFQAGQGFDEALLMNINIDMTVAKRLLDLGYSVATVFHTFECRKMYKISWEN
jgi:hypothetical protein